MNNTNNTAEFESLKFLNRLKSKLFNYYWFPVLFLILSLTIAFLVNRYSQNKFQIQADILIETDSRDFDASKLIFDNAKDFNSENLTNQFVIIKSFSLLQKTVNDLDQNIQYYRTTKALSRFIEIERSESPFKLSILDNGAVDGIFQLHVELTHSGFKIEGSDNAELIEGVYGDTFSFAGLSLRLNRKEEVEIDSEVDYYFSITPVSQIVNNYSANLQVSESVEGASIIRLSLIDDLPEKESAFVNKLIENFIELNLHEKNKGADGTIAFLDAELQSIKDSLKSIEGKLETFKRVKRIYDLSSEGHQIFDQIFQAENNLASLRLEARYFEILEDYLTDSVSNSILDPTAFGIEDKSLSGITDQIITLRTELNLLPEAFNQQVRKDYEKRLEELKNTLKTLVASYKDRNSLELKASKERVVELESIIGDLPSSEMTLLNIERLYKLSESLYLLLLEKKAEAEIAKSSNTSDVKVVDFARVAAGGPISPNKSRNYFVALFLTLLISSALFIFLAYNDDRILTKEEVQAELDMPFMGQVIKLKDPSYDMLIDKPKSRVSESFRSIRSGLKYIEGSEGIKIITVSSCFPGEGKTFFSNNLAMSSAISGVKTLVIGADLRKPKIHQDFGLTNDLGLTSVLSGNNKVEEVIVRAVFPNLDVLPSGPIPPNPMELLESKAFDALLSSLKETYDQIIIDSSPFSLVSDAKALFTRSDFNFLVLRSGFSKQINFDNILELKASLASSRFGIILNAVDPKSGNARYSSYNYGYYEE